MNPTREHMRQTRTDTQRINILDKNLHQMYYMNDSRGGTYVVELAKVEYKAGEAIHRIAEGVNPSLRKAIDQAYMALRKSQPVLTNKVIQTDHVST